MMASALSVGLGCPASLSVAGIHREVCLKNDSRDCPEGKVRLFGKRLNEKFVRGSRGG
jgi:hypothetical protein